MQNQDQITEQKRFTIVNELNPVHHCINAFQRDSECEYALCNECKITIENRDLQRSGKRIRSAYRFNNDSTYNEDIATIKRNFTERYHNTSPETNDEVDEDCNHKVHNLKFTVDKTNFDSTFLFQVKKMGRNYPTNYSKCHIEFCNK